MTLELTHDVFFLLCQISGVFQVGVLCIFVFVFVLQVIFFHNF